MQGEPPDSNEVGASTSPVAFVCTAGPFASDPASTALWACLRRRRRASSTAPAAAANAMTAPAMPVGVACVVALRQDKYYQWPCFFTRPRRCGTYRLRWLQPVHLRSCLRCCPGPLPAPVPVPDPRPRCRCRQVSVQGAGASQRQCFRPATSCGSGCATAQRSLRKGGREASQYTSYPHTVSALASARSSLPTSRTPMRYITISCDAIYSIGFYVDWLKPPITSAAKELVHNAVSCSVAPPTGYRQSDAYIFHMCPARGHVNLGHNSMYWLSMA